MGWKKTEEGNAGGGRERARARTHIHTHIDTRVYFKSVGSASGLPGDDDARAKEA